MSFRRAAFCLISGLKSFMFTHSSISCCFSENGFVRESILGSCGASGEAPSGRKRWDFVGPSILTKRFEAAFYMRPCGAGGMGRVTWAAQKRNRASKAAQRAAWVGQKAAALPVEPRWRITHARGPQRQLRLGGRRSPNTLT